MTREKYNALSLFQMLVLFIFVIVSVMLMLIGSKIYQNTVHSMESNLILRTTAGYLSNREREYGSRADIRDGILVFELPIENEPYIYRIYEHERMLVESLLPRGYDFEKGDGERIVAIDSFVVREMNEGIEVRFSYAGNEVSRLIEREADGKS